MKLKGKVILIISPERWGKVYVSKHHYALALAKRGNTVFFLNPPNLFKSLKIDITIIDNNLKTIDYKPFFRGSNRLPIVFRKIFHKVLANKIINSIDLSIDIVWSFDPSSFQYLNAFGAQLNIFHPVDIHRPRFERAIAKHVDLILSTSDRILERYKKVNKPKFKINHGLSYYFLSSESNNNYFIKRPDQINVGYVGNLHYRFLDIPLLKNIINLNPDIHFYFIGPYEKSNIGEKELNTEFVEWLKNLNNTYLIGSVASADLPSYLEKFDLFLMCYTGDYNITEMANPHKILEFLSTGKVVVTHYIDEYKNHDGIICMSKKNSDLPKLFSKVVNNLDAYNSNQKAEERISFAKNNTYNRQLNRIESIIENHL
ncbi:MAG: glycosyl transferase family 1 [Chloroflexi bacterium]|mgnify:CR=1 FL=1|nr:glycosyl transferase family 1 [Chloroflexota bacterium]MDP7195801.1 glycosyl transferase family 1 [SAR202 cluster bacterium]